MRLEADERDHAVTPFGSGMVEVAIVFRLDVCVRRHSAQAG
jgi:hypothetical protein